MIPSHCPDYGRKHSCIFMNGSCVSGKAWNLSVFDAELKELLHLGITGQMLITSKFGLKYFSGVFQYHIKESYSILSVVVRECIGSWIKCEASLLQVIIRSHVQEAISVGVVLSKGSHATSCSDTKGLVSQRCDI
jgi:hypothetical protein